MRTSSSNNIASSNEVFMNYNSFVIQQAGKLTNDPEVRAKLIDELQQRYNEPSGPKEILESFEEERIYLKLDRFGYILSQLWKVKFTKLAKTSWMICLSGINVLNDLSRTNDVNSEITLLRKYNTVLKDFLYQRITSNSSPTEYDKIVNTNKLLLIESSIFNLTTTYSDFKKYVEDALSLCKSLKLWNLEYLKYQLNVIFKICHYLSKQLQVTPAEKSRLEVSENTEQTFQTSDIIDFHEAHNRLELMREKSFGLSVSFFDTCQNELLSSDYKYNQTVKPLAPSNI